MTTKETNRGIENCNPLNIRRVAGTTWKGQRARQTDREFVQFECLEWGIRAAICLLRIYKRKYHLNCITEIITRWSPPSENETGQYIRNVCQWTGLAGRQQLTEAEWPALIKAMARQETGIQLDDKTIDDSFFLYKLTK